MLVAGDGDTTIAEMPRAATTATASQSTQRPSRASN
jgi:hypothetical protein